MSSVMWWRRDLRLRDNPALATAAAEGPVVPLFVLDPALWEPAGAPRRAYLVDSLGRLAEAVGGLTVRSGDPVREVVRVAREAGADQVHVAADFGPYGAARDERVDAALAEHGIELVRTGSPYAVAPGRVTKGDGTPYAVFTPFFRAWTEHGWRGPIDTPRVEWEVLDGERLPEATCEIDLPTAGEDAAHRRWQRFLDDKVAAYDEGRDRPDQPATSHMSVHLKWGEIHPRTMLADLAPLRDTGTGTGAATYRKELAWREFYADVLHHRPETARDYLRPEFARMEYDEPAGQLDAWREGRTGYPIVDAGMRQLAATGWMHNRVRMIVASFLVKDLHLEWQHGARHFMAHLVDGDLASNQHGWQWTAGCGTDAAPYFRVFNPVSQGRTFDPHGSYVRRWVPELRDAEDPHAPVDPIVDHADERREALARWERIRP
ncbi:MAG: cryptochrome/photolyase family protein [Nocardioides sp.]